MIKTILYPLIIGYSFIFLCLYSFTHNYGIALILLSIITSIVINFFNKLLKVYPDRQAQIQTILQPQIEQIKSSYKGEEKQKKIVNLYKKYRYHPILSLRSAVPLLIQLPFLLAAYYMLSNAEFLHEISFGIIKDLSKPDALLFGFNLLPIIMTAINIITAIITPNFSKKDLIQAVFIALLFLVLLYNSVSSLLLYWTMNNVIFFLKTVITKLTSKRKIEKSKMPLKWKVSFSIPNEVWIIAKHYFALLFIFYVLQLIALPGSKYFPSFLKYIPFAFAASCFFILQTRELLKSFIPDIKHITALFLMLFSIIVIAGLSLIKLSSLVSLDLPIPLLVTIISLILGLVAVLIGTLIGKKYKGIENTSTIQRLIFVILGIGIPALHFASVNTEYLKGIFYILYFLLLIGCALFIYFILAISCSHNTTKSRAAISAGIFLLLLVFLPVFRSLFKFTSKVDIDFWLIFAISMLISLLIKNRVTLKKILHIGIILFAVFFISFVYAIINNTAKGLYPRRKLNAEMSAIRFITKPNIYLFVYDGIPNFRVFRDQNLPLQPLQTLLEKYGFKTYEDTYSLGEGSLNSMGRTLNFTNKEMKGPEGRSLYSGNSYTNLIVRANEYSTHLLLDNYYVGMEFLYNKDLYDELYPPRKLSFVQSDFFFTLIRGIFQGEMRFDTEGLIKTEGFNEEDIQNHKLELIKSKLDKTFIINHYPYPSHSQNSGKCLPDETERWISRFNIALKQMEKDFMTIDKYDPQAIVIAIADHGPYLTGDCYNLAEWKKEDITEDLIWDRVGTLVAIKWPDINRASKYDNFLVTNQDIFPVIFAYLMDDPMPLKYCPDDVFWGLDTPFRTKIGFDKGKIIR